VNKSYKKTSDEKIAQKQRLKFPLYLQQTKKCEQYLCKVIMVHRTKTSVDI